MRERFGTESTANAASSARQRTPRGHVSHAILASAIALGCGASNDAAFAVPSDAAAERQQDVQSPAATQGPTDRLAPGVDPAEARADRSSSSADVGSLPTTPFVGGASDAAGAEHPASLAPPSAGDLHRPASTLGYNMDYPGDWTNNPPFIDQMKNARAVQGECSSADPGCDPAAHLDLDEQGWVRSLHYRDDASRAYAAAHVVFNTSSERPDIGKTFVVTWQGSANVQVYGVGEVRREAPQRLSFVLAAGNAMLTLRDIDPADHARDIRIFRTDHEALLERGEQFSPDMLAFLAPFGSLRFMDWMQSNTPGQCSGGTENGRSCYAVTGDDCGGGGVCSMPGHWAERPTADQSSLQAAGQYLDNERPELGTKVGGYPVETLVALANRASIDPHFNMPADYDDEFVRSFARYVRDHLEPGLRASVEYSNEVWNWGFPQAGYANALGRELFPDEGTAWVQFAAGRTANLCRIWKEEFAGQEQRLRCLISPQTDWRELAETVLECPAWVATHPGSGPCYEHVDAINITGYFSGCLHTHASAVQGWRAQGDEAALDLAFEQLEHGGLLDDCRDSLDDAISGYSYFAELAKPRGLDVYVYESGTHFAYDANDATRDFFVQMTRDERMYDAYQRNFGGFVAAGGTTFNVWGWVAKDDAWANSESVLELDHPKYRAIVDFAQASAR
jgi:hypothetical protein